MIKLMMRRGRVRTVEEVFFSLRSFSVFFLFISFIEKWFFFFGRFLEGIREFRV